MGYAIFDLVTIDPVTEKPSNADPVYVDLAKLNKLIEADMGNDEHEYEGL